MGLLRLAAQSMFGDRVPSVEEQTLRRQAKQQRRRARWANRLSPKSDSTRMKNMQALQMAIAYESAREQRYRRLVTMYSEKKSQGRAMRFTHRAECSQLVISQLQQQLAAYQPPQQTNTYLPPTYYTVVQSPQQQSGAAVAAIPIATQHTSANHSLPAPPPYSGPEFFHYPTINPTASSPSSSSFPSSASSYQSSPSSLSFGDRNSQLQEPWLKAGEQRTVY